MTTQHSVDSSVQVTGHDGPPRKPPVTRLWDRRLAHYPNNGPRAAYLAIVVLVSVVLYYQLYIQGAVATSILNHYRMSFTFFVYVSVVGSVFGALASVAAGLADRWGRANLVTYGVLLTSLLILFGVPNAPNKTAYLIMFTAVSVVEGVVLVATPALVRDFSPQLGRASAMGFWTLGPVLGSLVVTEVSSHTLSSTHPVWQNQFHYAGIAGLAMFVVALIGLRELSPPLRDQLMVSLRDRALIEAKARGLNTEELLHHAWRRLLKLDIVGSALAISIFLLLYYTAVGFIVVYFATNFGYSESRANSLANWYWIPNAVALVVVGLLSDALKVRKPFMILGGLISAAGTAVFAVKSTDSHTSYYTFAVIFMIISVGGAMAYAPWMASFTETVERHNPAATATGLAIWGGILRTVVAVSLILLAGIMTATSTLVEKGPTVQTLAAKYSQEITTIQAVDPVTFATLVKKPTDTTAGLKAVGEVSAKLKVTPGVALQRLLAVNKAPKADLEYLQANGPGVQKAVIDSPHQWRSWWWVCFACQLLFIPFVFVMAGRWSPRKAREDAREHEALVDRELSEMSAASTLT